MGEGSAARGGVAELLALVAVGDALVDGEDVPGVELSTRLREISHSGLLGPSAYWNPQLLLSQRIYFMKTLY